MGFCGRLCCISVAIAALLVAACRRPAAQSTPPTVKAVEIAAKQLADELPASGAVEAVDKVQLGFMVPGRIVSMEVDDGARVEKDQLLARLDDTDYRNEVAIAAARLTEIRARHERLTQLHELGSLTATDHEKIIAARAEAESAAALTQRRLDYTQLRAPFAGRIVRHGAAAGTVVAPGIPVVSVLAEAPVWATLSIPEADATRIQVGATATVWLAASEEVRAVGTVETILPQADPITRSFAAKVKVANENGAFRPGNVVTARIATGASRQTLTLSPHLIHRYADGALHVWLADSSRGTVSRRIITVGRTTGTEIEVTSGLSAGDRVVIVGAEPLFDGMQVRLSQP